MDFIRKKDPIIILLIILTIFLFIYNIFNISIMNFSIPETDPLNTFERVSLSIKNGHITLHDSPDGIGIMNLEENFYPVGFYANLIFLAIIRPENLFFFIKFFGPFISFLSILQLYQILKKITKSSTSSLIGIIIWQSVFISIGFSMITVASGLGFYLSFCSINTLFDNTKNAKILSGMLAGAGLLIHTITGGIFIIFCSIFYLILRQNDHLYDENEWKKTKIHDFFKYILSLFVIILPYLILLKLGQINTIIRFIFPNFNLFNLYIQNNIMIFQNSTSIELFWDFPYIFSQLIIFGPSSYVYLFIFLVFINFKKNKSTFYFSFSLIFISLLYIINPIYIHGVGIRDMLSYYYPFERIFWFLTLGIIINTSIGFSEFEKKLTKFFNYISTKNKIDIKPYFSKRVLYIILLLILGIETRITMSYYPFGINWWKISIPQEYTESIVWIGQNSEPNEDIILPLMTSSYTSREAIEFLYTGVNPQLRFHELNYYYSNDENSTINILLQDPELFLNQTSIEQYDYVLIPIDYLGNFEEVIKSEYFLQIFSSLNNQYYIFEIKVDFNEN